MAGMMTTSSPSADSAQRETPQTPMPQATLSTSPCFSPEAHLRDIEASISSRSTTSDA